MWWYNILEDNKVSISHLLWLHPITAECILLTDKLVALKKENYDPIITVKIIEWSKLVDYFCLSIETKPSRVGKKNIYIVQIGYILIP